MIFDRLADVIQRRAKLIIVLWVVGLVCMGFFAMKSGEVMSYDINSQASDDSESKRGLEIIEDYFPSSDLEVTAMPILLLYYEDRAELLEAQRFVDSLAKEIEPDERFGDITSMDPTSETGPGIIMAMIAVKDMDEEEVEAFTPGIRSIINKVATDTGFVGAKFLTGNTAISYDMEHNSMEDIEKIDPFTVLMILVLVGLFFRSFVTSATPPMTIGFAFVITMGLIYFIGQLVSIFYLTNMLILVSMMGAGCDYCIFIIARYREELRKGLSHDESVHQAIVWAGESITISGASVMIGFGAMSISSYGLISTMGICLALGILVALLAALTLIPSILQIIGDRIFWPTRLKEYMPGGKATKGWYARCARFGNRYFESSVHFSLRHAKAILVATILVTVPAVYLMNESEDSYDMITAMLSGESGDGMSYISEYADQGMVMPNYTIYEYRESLGVATKTGDMLGTVYWSDFWKDRVSKTLPPLYDEIAAIDNIAYVEGVFVWDDLVEGIKKEGITDTDQKVQYVKDHLSSKNAMIFQKLVDELVKNDFDVEYLFEGPGAMIEEELEEAEVDFDWDDTIEEARSKGITETDDILDYVKTAFGAAVADKFREEFNKTIKEKDVSSDVVIYGPGKKISEELRKSGMDFDWDAAVQECKDKGMTDPELIIKEVLQKMEYSIQDSFVDKMKKTFDKMLKPYLENPLLAGYNRDTLLVHGLGPLIDNMLSSYFSLTLKERSWEAEVDYAYLTTSDPDDIIEHIKNNNHNGNVDHDALLDGAIFFIISALGEQGVNEAMAVYGVAPSIDSGLSGTVELGWFDMMKISKMKGFTKDSDIVTDVLSSYGKEIASQAILTINSEIDKMVDKGVDKDLLVNGIGSMFDEELEDFDIDLKWDEVVAEAKTKGFNTSAQILDDVLNTYSDAISAKAIEKIDDAIDELKENDLSTDVMVYGFGPIIDYVMNVTNKTIGGEFAVNESGRGTITFILLSSATEEAAMSPRSMASITEIVKASDNYIINNAGIVVNNYDTGTAVVMHDVADTVKSQFKSIEILVVILIMILLLVVMRSYLIPIRSVLTIMMSIAWTLAATDLIFVHLLGGSIIWLVPILLLVICLGLGMDYDILLTTRIKENVVARGMSNDDAIHDAVTHTGSVITICGLIMGGAFGTLMISGIPMLRQFGFALCFAILVDALIVRTYIVPAVMHLLGDWNWKGPGSKKLFGRN